MVKLGSGHGALALPTLAHLPSVGERRARGREIRSVLPRLTLGQWHRPDGRPDPVKGVALRIATLPSDVAQTDLRRYTKNPYTWFVATPGQMAADLRDCRVTGFAVQLNGDATVTNVAALRAPDGIVHVDFLRFDETIHGPWESDVRRLATSAFLLSTVRKLDGKSAEGAARAAAEGYRLQMAEVAEWTNLEVWRARLAGKVVTRAFRPNGTPHGKAWPSDAIDPLLGVEDLTEVVERVRQFREQPGQLVRVTTDEELAWIDRGMEAYSATLPEGHRALLAQYHVVDVARQPGDRGHDALVLLEGRDVDDALILEVREARPSAMLLSGLEPLAPDDGQRIVAGQRAMEAEPDPLLGYVPAGTGEPGVTWRQRPVAVGTLAPEGCRAAQLVEAAGLAGRTLALAHARSGDRIAIASYLGGGENFADAMATFAARYTDQVLKDHAAVSKAVKAGKLAVKG